MLRAGWRSPTLQEQLVSSTRERIFTVIKKSSSCPPGPSADTPIYFSSVASVFFSLTENPTVIPRSIRIYECNTVRLVEQKKVRV